jgi:hypothetical protein
MVLTLKATPALAGTGSPQRCNNGVGNGSDCLPPGIDQNGKTFLDNDDVTGVLQIRVASTNSHRLRLRVL